MTTIESILSRLTKAVGGTEKMLYIEPELWISLDVITNYLPDIKQNHLSQ